MSLSQILVVVFAIGSAAVSALAIWRVARAKGAAFKPLWIAGSLFGFAGLATDMSSPGDLYLKIGIQIPVLSIWRSGTGDIYLQALFPIVAIVALEKVRPRRDRSGD